MAIHTSCPKCGAQFQLADTLALKTARCNRCQGTFVVPKPATPEIHEFEEVPEFEPVGTMRAGSPPQAAAFVPVPPESAPPPSRYHGPSQPAPSYALYWILGGVFGFLVLVGLAGVAFFFVKTDEVRVQVAVAKPDIARDFPKPAFPIDNFEPAPMRPPLSINATLAIGRFHTESRLDNNDGREPERRHLCKIYVVPLIANRGYVIDLESPTFDAYLRLEDPHGRTVASDDDGGNGLNARIRHVPDKSGSYRIFATMCSPGVGPFALSVREDNAALVKNPQNPLPPDALPQPEVKLPELKLPNSTAPAKSLVRIPRAKKEELAVTTLTPPGKIVADVVWLPNGEAFFTLTENGQLSRIAADTFVEEKRLDMVRRTNFLALSARGLLVTMTDLKEIWIVDPATLEVKKRIGVPGIHQGMSGPTLNFAVASCASSGAFNRDGGVAAVVDLATGEFATTGAPTAHARITPDGKFYFAQGGIEQLCGYQIEGNQLRKSGETGRIAQNGQSIAVSPDSKYVCLPSGGGNYGVGYGTHIYSVNDLTKPEFTLTSGAYPRRVGFDPVGQFVFAQNFDKQLIVYTTTAIKLKEYVLSQRGNEPQQFVAHPRGGKLLILVGNDLLYVELEGLKAGVP